MRLKIVESVSLVVRSHRLIAIRHSGPYSIPQRTRTPSTPAATSTNLCERAPRQHRNCDKEGPIQKLEELRGKSLERVNQASDVEIRPKQTLRLAFSSLRAITPERLIQIPASRFPGAHKREPASFHRATSGAPCWRKPHGRRKNRKASIPSEILVSTH